MTCCSWIEIRLIDMYKAADPLEKPPYSIPRVFFAVEIVIISSICYDLVCYKNLVESPAGKGESV